MTKLASNEKMHEVLQELNLIPEHCVSFELQMKSNDVVFIRTERLLTEEQLNYIKKKIGL